LRHGLLFGHFWTICGETGGIVWGVEISEQNLNTNKNNNNKKKSWVKIRCEKNEIDRFIGVISSQIIFKTQ
jgi:hypothetical protein